MTRHELDASEIDDLDEMDGGEQLALVWCNTHENYEWHYIPVANVLHGGILEVERDPA